MSLRRICGHRDAVFLLGGGPGEGVVQGLGFHNVYDVALRSLGSSRRLHKCAGHRVQGRG